MASKNKTFKAKAAPANAALPATTEELAREAVVHLGVSPVSKRTVDLRPWIGHGCDEWVWALAAQLRTLAASGTVALATVAGYSIGAVEFLQFLVALGIPSRPLELDRAKIDQFVRWLGGREALTRNSQKTVYAKLKALVIGLRGRGLVPKSDDLFPQNPFPGSHLDMRGEAPLTQSERAALAEAIRKDIIAIHRGEFWGSEGIALVVYVVALGMRTGLNPTPLMELPRNALGIHPFMPNMRVLRSFKRRGRATNLKNLRKRHTDTEHVSVPLDGVAILEAVLNRTASLVGSAAAADANRIWLYKPDRHGDDRAVVALTLEQVAYGLRRIVAQHQLESESGGPLKLNLSRLRKTMENRLWRLSNGDIFAVATIMGQTPKVADQHYLAVTEDMRSHAAIVGEALPAMYVGKYVDEAGATRNLSPTPVAKCKDTLHGDLAPKDGVSHCADFFSCFRCRSFAVVGSMKDLHRLFSFYWFLDSERRRITSKSWAEYFASLMVQIDAFAADKFDEDLVDEAKDLAKVEPLRFWKNYAMVYKEEVSHGR